MNARKTVLIIDNQSAFRNDLKLFLSGNPEFDLVGEATNIFEGNMKAEELRPDMVLTDWDLPDQSGIYLIEQLYTDFKGIRSVMLCNYSRYNYITTAFKAGATGYLLKDSLSDQLAKCLKAVSMGEYFLDESLSHQLVKSILISDQENYGLEGRNYDKLSRIEQHILRHLAEKKSIKEIAVKHAANPETVENHRMNIMKKLNIGTNAGLLRYAAWIGLVDIEKVLKNQCSQGGKFS
ncbi:MAG: response regulator transcription factor [Desulfosarcina sp.]|nr:response regulator transcription factor [Desulfobacterales bacterium]